ncbi:MAG: hypothetical protein AAF404_02360 [Pseudomonadota bacterium]
MISRILVITTFAASLAACGGGGGSSSSSSGGNNNSGGSGSELSGVAGDFGDTADSSNSIRGTYTLCPANTLSFSTFTEVNGNWCVPGCPDTGVENDDGDEYGSFLAENNVDRYTCLITDNAPGSQVEIFFAAPINGCDAASGGCPAGSFPAVFISATAGDELANEYRCADWSFDVDTQAWTELSSPAPFSLTLNVDRSATIGGTSTSWTFVDGSLMLEGSRTFNNVAVGNGSFTEYTSNIYITRCKA